MQPYFLPYIGYFQLINAVDVFVAYGSVNFMSKSWISRNRILGPEEDSYIRPTILGRSVSKTISEIAVDSGELWRRKLFSSIMLTYSGFPFENETRDLLEELIYHQAPTLDSYNTFGIRLIAAHLGIETEIMDTQSVPETVESHARVIVDPPERRQSRVTEICDSVNADTYVNPASGQHLYAAEYFRLRNKKLLFLEPDLTATAQEIGTSRADLSIVHCLMVGGKEKVRKALTLCRYRLGLKGPSVHI